MNHKKSRILSRTAAYAAALAFSLIAALAVFVAVFPERWSQLSLKMNPHDLKKLHSEISGSRWPLGAFRYHEQIGYEMTPGFSSEIRNGLFKICTHNLGYRIPTAQDRTAYSPGGILSVGCSFTYGDLVEAEQTFSYHAASVLGLEAYNYGVCSYSYVSSLLQLQDLRKKGVLDLLEPSVLVLGAGKWLYRRSVDPFLPTTGLRFAFAHLAKENGNLGIKQPLAELSLKHLFAFRTQYFPKGFRESEFTEERRQLLTGIAPTILAAENAQKNWKTDITEKQVYEFVISEMRKISLSEKMRFVVFWLARDTSDLPPQALAAALASFDDVLLVNGAKALVGLGADEIRQDGHPTPEAHRRYGLLLAKMLRQHQQQQKEYNKQR